MSATDHARTTASRAARSKPLEYLARGGFIGYGVIHLLFAWLALQIAFSGSGTESDQSGALRKLAEQPAGKALVILIVIGLVAMAIWQAFEAAIGESGQSGRSGTAERVVSGFRAVLYAYFAYIGYKVVKGISSSQADSQEAATGKLMAEGGGRFLVGLIGLIVLGIGIGLVIYGVTKKFEKHLNTAQMGHLRQTIRRLGVAGYSAKGVAYGIAGGLIVAAAVTYDAEKARGLDAALRTLAGQSYGPWLLGLVALGIAAFGVYCFFQARYRKV